MRVVAVLLPVAFLLLFAELAQRVSDGRKAAARADRIDPYAVRGETRGGVPVKGDVERGRLVLELDPHLLFPIRPDQELPGLRINAQGFRGADWELAKPPGTRRVVVLGGSTAFGKAASSDTNTFAALLEERLAPRGAIQVLNAGMIAFDSNQERILLATRLLDYAPDLIVYFDGWNDFYYGGQRKDGRPPEHPHFQELEQALVDGRRPWLGLLRLSALYRGIERRWPGWRLSLGLDDPPDRGFGRFRHEPEAVARYRRNLERMIRLARAYGADSLVAPQPEIFDRADPSEFEQYKREQLESDGYADYARAHWRDYVRAAFEVARAEGVAQVALQDVFGDLEGDAFVDLVHLTDRGHARVADALRAPVQRVLEARDAGPAR